MTVITGASLWRNSGLFLNNQDIFLSDPDDYYALETAETRSFHRNSLLSRQHGRCRARQTFGLRKQTHLQIVDFRSGFG